MASRTFAPTSVTLAKEIKSIIEKGTDDPKLIGETLLNDNPTWKVPERRLNKFIKSALAADKTDNSEEMSRAHSLRRFFSKKTVVKAAESAPPAISQTAKEEDVKETEDESLMPTVATEEDTKENTYNETIYNDDNDGKKECGCWCK